MALSPNAIIAVWINEERTRSFQLQANGDLVETTRKTVSDVWSPPSDAGFLKEAVTPFRKLLAKLITPERKPDWIYKPEVQPDGPETAEGGLIGQQPY